MLGSPQALWAANLPLPQLLPLRLPSLQRLELQGGHGGPNGTVSGKIGESVYDSPTTHGTQYPAGFEIGKAGFWYSGKGVGLLLWRVLSGVSFRNGLPVLMTWLV